MRLRDITRRQFIAGAASAPAAMMLGAERPALGAASGKKFNVRYGVAVRGDMLVKDVGYRDVILAHCDEIVPEGDLKFSEVQPNPGEFRFEKADAIAAFARENKLALRGHTLAWYGALPYWTDDLRTRRDAERALGTFIETAVDRYRGLIRSWDVVNEPTPEDPRSASELRASVWTKNLGRDYLSFAFRKAASVDPKAQLVLNEYDIEPVGRRFDLRRAGLLQIARELKDRGDPLHAIGLQAHLTTERAINRDGLQSFLSEVKRMGLKVLITELDVVDNMAPAEPTLRDAAVAAKAEEFLSAVCEVTIPETIVTWGISDRYTWVPIYFKRGDGRPNRPLPFDEQMQRKPFMDVIDRYRRDRGGPRNG